MCVATHIRYDDKDVIALESSNQGPLGHDLTDRKNDHRNKRNPGGKIDDGPTMVRVDFGHFSK